MTTKHVEEQSVESLASAYGVGRITGTMWKAIVDQHVILECIWPVLEL